MQCNPRPTKGDRKEIRENIYADRPFSSVNHICLHFESERGHRSGVFVRFSSRRSLDCSGQATVDYRMFQSAGCRLEKELDFIFYFPYISYGLEIVIGRLD